MERPLILVTNDDGFRSSGIEALVSVAKEFGDVVVLAPDSPRSGMSSALTPGVPLKVKEISNEGSVRWMHCSGTPADCVKLALTQLLDRKPDLLLSGINHGSNAAINVTYSGTMGATHEGCVSGIPSIGFSLCDHAEFPDFNETCRLARLIVADVLKNGLADSVCLNVNVPIGTAIKGVRVSKQAKSRWTNDFAASTDPFGRTLYWLTGDFINLEPENEETDEWALRNGYCSVVPCQVDRTAYAAMNEMANRLRNCFEF